MGSGGSNVYELAVMAEEYSEEFLTVLRRISGIVSLSGI